MRGRLAIQIEANTRGFSRAMDQVERRTRNFRGGSGTVGGGVGGAAAGAAVAGGIGPTGAILAARAGRLGATVLGGASVIGAHRKFNRFYMDAVRKFSSDYQIATSKFEAEILRMEMGMGQSLGRAFAWIPNLKTSLAKAVNDWMGYGQVGAIKDASGQRSLSRFSAESQAAGLAALRRRVL